MDNLDNLLIYSQAEEEHLKYLQLVFEKFRKAVMQFFKNEIEYLRDLVSGQGISPMRQRIKAITSLAPTTNITEAWHMIGLIGYFRKFFPVFSDMIRPLNELTRKMDGVISKKLGLHQASHHYNPQLSLSCPR